MKIIMKNRGDQKLKEMHKIMEIHMYYIQIWTGITLGFGGRGLKQKRRDHFKMLRF